MSRKILVTGGAGYIGSHMHRQLTDAGHQVVVFDSLERGNRDAVGDTLFVQGDLCRADDIAAVFDAHADIDAVMHFAAYAYVGESVHEPTLYYRNNVAGTLNLLDAMQRAGVDKLVFSSTCATYGVPESLPITESTPQRPINPYGRSKLMVEEILRDQAVAHGLRSVALRYFNAAGCHPDGSIGERHDPETHLLPLILFEALRVQAGGDPADTTLTVFGDDFDTRDGTCVRDYIHVEDLCAAHTAALAHMDAEPGKGAEQFNLGTNRGYTVLEAIRAAEAVTGVTIGFKRGDRRAGDPPELVADASLAMNTLNWTPRYADIEQSLEHAWHWFSANPPEAR